MTKFWYLRWNDFSFLVSTITLDTYSCRFKICWVYPSHALTSVKNLKEEILWSRLIQISGSQFSRIHYDQPNNKTIKYVRGPIGFVNCTSNELQRNWEIAEPKIAEYLKQVESKIPKCTHQKDPHNYEHHPVHNVMFRKDYIPA